MTSPALSLRRCLTRDRAPSEWGWWGRTGQQMSPRKMQDNFPNGHVFRLRNHLVNAVGMCETKGVYSHGKCLWESTGNQVSPESDSLPPILSLILTVRGTVGDMGRWGVEAY